MTIIDKVAYVTVCILILSSCFKERIELNLNEGNRKVIISAWLTDLDEQQFVLVNYSAPYLKPTEIEFISHAEVTLSYRDSTIIFSHVADGIYEAPQDWHPIADSSYTLEVTVDDNLYAATAEMRTMPEAENFKTLQTFEKDSILLYELYFSFAENPGEGDGYYGVDYLKGSNGGDTLSRGGFVNDDFIDGQYFEDVVLTEDGYMVGDTIVLEIFSIGTEASNYLLDVINETFRDGIFNPPPVNVRSNFSGDALGYFIVSGARKYEVIVE